MSKRKIFIFLGASLILFAAALWASGQTVEEQLKKGDEFYAQNDYPKALEQFLAAAQADPKSYEAQWKACRSLVDVGDLVDAKVKGNEEKQKKYYQDAEAYGRRAVALNPNDTWGHFSLSAAMGKHALMLGKKQQVQMAKEIKNEVEKAIELDATNDGAFHALGRWHRRMDEIGGFARLMAGIYGGLPKGTFEESEKYLKKATELKPGFINHHLELGRTYLALKKYQPAADEFQKCLDLPASTPKDPGYKKEAEEELAGAKKKIK
jgi:tetratricopeptide (TPR) repeat protein